MKLISVVLPLCAGAFTCMGDDCEARLVSIVYATPRFGTVLPEKVEDCGDGLYVHATSDLALYPQADALVFHMYDTARMLTDPAWVENMRRTHEEIQRYRGRSVEAVPYISPFDARYRRRPEQLWILHSEESSAYDMEHGFEAVEKMLPRFNFTATMHRRDMENGWVPMFPENVEDLVKPPVPTAERMSAPVMWMSKSCNTPSRREEVVRKLGEYIEIDSYGECYHTKDWDSAEFGELGSDYGSAEERGNDPALRRAVGKHKFYLAFENAECEDYVTEKYWRAIEEGAVPVILGWHNNSDFEVAPHSTIQLTDFPSVRALAEYLRLLDSNDKLYEGYLWYKNRRPEDVLSKRFLELHARRRGLCGMAARVAELQNDYRGSGKTVQASYANFCPAVDAWSATVALE